MVRKEIKKIKETRYSEDITRVVTLYDKNGWDNLFVISKGVCGIPVFVYSTTHKEALKVAVKYEYKNRHPDDVIENNILKALTSDKDGIYTVMGLMATHRPSKVITKRFS